MLEAVIFDMDGLLVDAEPVWEDARRGISDMAGSAWGPSRASDARSPPRAASGPHRVPGRRPCPSSRVRLRSGDSPGREGEPARKDRLAFQIQVQDGTGPQHLQHDGFAILLDRQIAPQGRVLALAPQLPHNH